MPVWFDMLTESVVIEVPLVALVLYQYPSDPMPEAAWTDEFVTEKVVTARPKRNRHLNRTFRNTTTPYSGTLL